MAIVDILLWREGETRLINPKKVKRALAGFSVRDVQMPTEEAIFRLMKSGVVENKDLARELLDYILDNPLEYSTFGEFSLSKIGQEYRVEIYPLRNILTGF